MVGLGFLNETNAPTEEAKMALIKLAWTVHDLKLSRRPWFFSMMRPLSKPTVISLLFGQQRTRVMRPKSKGSGVMVSDFVSERDRYLALTDAEYEIAKQTSHQFDSMLRSIWNTVRPKKGTGRLSLCIKSRR